MAPQDGFKTPVTRYYIDVRALAPDGPYKSSQTVDLPYIETLPSDSQEAIRKYLRPSDKLMSLSSALLKFLFIHRTAKIPWSQVRVSRTPKPHGRPYWNPPDNWHGDGFEGLEFNVSHQAGIVVLLGCHTPNRPEVPLEDDSLVADDSQSVQSREPDPDAEENTVRVGVDVACSKEYRRTPDTSTQAKFAEWVDVFGEMFSEREMKDIKTSPVSSVSSETGSAGLLSTIATEMDQKTRRFYTYWALKEAYIKMVGEGLIAGWLKQLEFVNVTPPRPHQKFTAEEAGLQVVFQGKDITHKMRTELEGFEEIFLLASMVKGVDETATDSDREWVRLEFEKDIKPCATGTCSCL